MPGCRWQTEAQGVSLRMVDVPLDADVTFEPRAELLPGRS